MPSITEKLKLAIEWLPVLQMLPAIATAEPGRKRAIEVARLCELLATKTGTDVDDKLVRLVFDILLTPQGGALLDYLADLVREIKFDDPDPA